MPEKLHPLVIKTKIELEKLDRQDIKTWGERHRCRGAILPISVEPKLRKRALSFMNDFVKLVESKGHKMKIIYEQCFVEAYGETTQINLRQKFYRKRIKETNDYYSHNKFVESEDLEFQIGYSYKKGWIDKKNNKIEDQLQSIFKHIETESKYFFELRQKKKIEQEELQKQRKIEEEKLRLESIEKAKFDKLLKKSRNYKTAKEIRVYLNDLDIKMTKENKNDEKHQAYISWGYRKANELDPLENLE